MYDLAVYGSGFAGYAVAAPALEKGYRVVVVEKGPRLDFRKSVELAHIDSPWDPVESAVSFGDPEYAAKQNPPRLIGLGGTSAVWWGRWRPLDTADFLRHGEHGRCWPFYRNELEPYYHVVSTEFDFSLEKDPALEPIRSRLADAGLRLVPTAVQPIRLAEKWIRLERDYPQLTILTDVRRSEFRFDNGAVGCVRLENRDGNYIEIRARQHVIAAGGIESAGLVRELHETATGEINTFLSGYMDHPKGVAGKLLPTKRLDELGGLLLGGHEAGLSLPEDELLECGIGNHIVFLTRRSRRNGIFPACLGSRAVTLMVHAEQVPEAWNGIDYRRPSEVRWRTSAKTRRDVDRFLRIMASRIEPLFGRVDVRSWINFRGASHPAGCTPMSSTPSGCQLHPDGRLSSVANAYCISSSAFPFAGSANPTMTVAALGYRLSTKLTCQA
jgi:choline dehydrogenase-like flavoprotein